MKLKLTEIQKYLAERAEIRNRIWWCHSDKDQTTISNNVEHFAAEAIGKLKAALEQIILEPHHAKDIALNTLAEIDCVDNPQPLAESPFKDGDEW